MFSLASIYLSYEVAVAKIAGKLGSQAQSTRSATVWTLNTPSQLKLASRITILLEFRKSSMHAWNGIHFHTGDGSDNANELPCFSRSLQNCGDCFSDGTIHASSYIVLQPIRLADSFRCWFVKKYYWLVCVREKYCSGWKFMIVYDKPQPNEQAGSFVARLICRKYMK